MQTCTCGSNHIIIKHSPDLNYYAQCQECGNMVFNCETRVEAIDYWNMSQIINKRN